MSKAQRQALEMIRKDASRKRYARDVDPSISQESVGASPSIEIRFGGGGGEYAGPVGEGHEDEDDELKP